MLHIRAFYVGITLSALSYGSPVNVISGAEDAQMLKGQRVKVRLNNTFEAALVKHLGRFFKQIL